MQYALAGTAPQQPTARQGWILAAGAVVVILNLFDAIFTLLYVRLGHATESNPLMDRMLAASPVLFMAAKLTLVSLGVLLLWRLRDHRAARFGLVATGAAYVLLLCYHLTGVERLV